MRPPARLLGLSFALTMLSPFSATARADAEVELITVYPGDAAFTRFGHSAMRVRQGSFDGVYSFGNAPFDEPSFLSRYLRGEAEFVVKVRTWQAAVDRYASKNRTFVRQPLDLDASRATAIARALEGYRVPGRDRYVYDQLRDNCATRLRDVLDDATDGALRRTSQGATGRRYRDHTLRAAAGAPLLSFTLDLIGGPNQETELDGWAELYLPRYLHDAVASAEVDGRSLNTETITVIERVGPPATAGPLRVGRYGWLSIAFVIALFVVLTGRSRLGTRIAGGSLVVFGALTFAGALLVDGLVALSSVADFSWNENMLAWLPTDIVLSWIGLRWLREPSAPPTAAWLRAYVAARPVWAVILILLTLVGVLPQSNVVFTAAPAIVFAALALRSRRGASATE